jgi:hypothetical protein
MDTPLRVATVVNRIAAFSASASTSRAVAVMIESNDVTCNSLQSIRLRMFTDWSVIDVWGGGASDDMLHPTQPDGLLADEDLKAELERLRQENASLKRGAAKGVSLKVSEKGGVSVYGLGRFPITLYKEQWAKLLDMADDIRSFIATHDKDLKSKT